MTAETVNRIGQKADGSTSRRLGTSIAEVQSDRGTSATEQSKGGLLGDSAKIAAASAISRITGLLRIVVAASVLGATVLGDLFVAINVLPLTLYDVFAGSAITSVLVPPLVKLLGSNDRTAARRFAANSLGIICGAMATLAFGAILARPLLASALTAGVDRNLASDAIEVGSLLLLLILPQLVLYAAIGVFVSIQHAERRFLIPSAAPIVENLGLLLTIGYAWRRFGTGFEVDSAPTALVLTLAIGSGLSVAAHAIVQFCGARSALGSIRLRAEFRDPEIRRLAKPARASFGWSTIIAVRQFALVVAAGFAGAGGVQAFEFAMLAYFIPVALIGRPIASAALPRLASAGGEHRAVLRGYLGALRVAAWIAVPAGVALVVLSGPFASVIAQGEFSSENGILMLTYGLAGLGIGAASDALFEVARQATMAIDPSNNQEAFSRARIGLIRSTWIRAAVAIVGIPTVIIAVDGPIVLLALGLVVSAGDLVALAVVHRGLRAGADWPTGSGRKHWPLIGATATIATVVPFMAARAVGVVWNPLTVAALSVSVCLCYAATAIVVTRRGALLKALVRNVQASDDPINKPTEEPT